MNPRTPRAWKSVLLVTSHPDDESMFFGPTIQAAKRMGAQVHILCLSTGNADGLGEVRAKELDAAGVLFRRRVGQFSRRRGASRWLRGEVACGGCGGPG